MNTEPRHKLTVKVLDALRTIQGYTMEEYQAARDELIADLSKDAEAVALAKAAGHASPLTVPPVTVADIPDTSQGGWEAPTPAVVPSFQNATVPSCAHGPRTAKSGASAKGPWRAWMCPAPKGDPSQCQPDWVTRGTPAWNNFPA